MLSNKEEEDMEFSDGQDGEMLTINLTKDSSTNSGNNIDVNNNIDVINDNNNNNINTTNNNHYEGGSSVGDALMKYGSSNESGQMLARELLARELQARELLSREMGSQNESQDRKRRSKSRRSSGVMSSRQYGSSNHHHHHHHHNSYNYNSAIMDSCNNSLDGSIMSRSRWEADPSESFQHESASLPAEFLYFKFEQIVARWAEQKTASVMSLERRRPKLMCRPPRTITTIANAIPEHRGIPRFMRNTATRNIQIDEEGDGTISSTSESISGPFSVSTTQQQRAQNLNRGNPMTIQTGEEAVPMSVPSPPQTTNNKLASGRRKASPSPVRNTTTIAERRQLQERTVTKQAAAPSRPTVKQKPSYAEATRNSATAVRRGQTPTKRAGGASPMRSSSPLNSKESTSLQRRNTPTPSSSTTPIACNKQKMDNTTATPVASNRKKNTIDNHTSSSLSKGNTETRSPLDTTEQRDAPHYVERESPAIAGEGPAITPRRKRPQQQPPTKPDPDGPAPDARPDPDGDRWTSPIGKSRSYKQRQRNQQARSPSPNQNRSPSPNQSGYRRRSPSPNRNRSTSPWRAIAPADTFPLPRPASPSLRSPTSNRLPPTTSPEKKLQSPQAKLGTTPKAQTPPPTPPTPQQQQQQQQQSQTVKTTTPQKTTVKTISPQKTPQNQRPNRDVTTPLRGPQQRGAGGASPAKKPPTPRAATPSNTATSNSPARTARTGTTTPTRSKASPPTTRNKASPARSARDKAAASNRSTSPAKKTQGPLKQAVKSLKQAVKSSIPKPDPTKKKTTVRKPPGLAPPEPPPPTRRKRVSRLPPLPSFRNPPPPAKPKPKPNQAATNKSSPGKGNTKPAAAKGKPNGKSPAKPVAAKGQQKAASNEGKGAKTQAPGHSVGKGPTTPTNASTNVSPRTPGNTSSQKANTKTAPPKMGTPKNGSKTPKPRDAPQRPRSAPLRSPKNPEGKAPDTVPRYMAPKTTGKQDPPPRPHTRRVGRVHKRAATLIQSFLRMVPIRKKFLKVLYAIVMLQSLLRRKIQMEKFKRDIKGTRLQNFSCVVIQKYYRMATCRTSYIQLRNTVIILQSAARMLSCRTAYIELRSASKKLLGRSNLRPQPELMPVNQATVRGGRLRIYSALLIQSVVRMRWVRGAYFELRSSAQVLQRWFRKVRIVLRAQHRAARVLQYWAHTLSWRSCFLDLRSSAITMQSFARMACAKLRYHAMKQIRLEDSAATTIQSLYRKDTCRNAYSQLRQAAMVLQGWTHVLRARKALRQAQRGALILRSVKVLQKWSRHLVARREMIALRSARVMQRWTREMRIRNAFKRLRRATITLQCWARQMSSERLVLHTICARLIQACFRGYSANKAFIKKRTCASMIQAVVRGCIYRVQFLYMELAAINVQRRVRGKLARTQRCPKTEYPFRSRILISQRKAAREASKHYSDSYSDSTDSEPEPSVTTPDPSETSIIPHDTSTDSIESSTISSRASCEHQDSHRRDGQQRSNSHSDQSNSKPAASSWSMNSASPQLRFSFFDSGPTPPPRTFRNVSSSPTSNHSLQPDLVNTKRTQSPTSADPSSRAYSSDGASPKRTPRYDDVMSAALAFVSQSPSHSSQKDQELYASPKHAKDIPVAGSNSSPTLHPKSSKLAQRLVREIPQSRFVGNSSDQATDTMHQPGSRHEYQMSRHYRPGMSSEDDSIGSALPEKRKRQPLPDHHRRNHRKALRENRKAPPPQDGTMQNDEVTLLGQALEKESIKGITRPSDSLNGEEKLQLSRNARDPTGDKGIKRPSDSLNGEEKQQLSRNARDPIGDNRSRHLRPKEEPPESPQIIEAPAASPELPHSALKRQLLEFPLRVQEEPPASPPSRTALQRERATSPHPQSISETPHQFNRPQDLLEDSMSSSSASYIIPGNLTDQESRPIEHNISSEYPNPPPPQSVATTSTNLHAMLGNPDPMDFPRPQMLPGNFIPAPADMVAKLSSVELPSTQQQPLYFISRHPDDESGGLPKLYALQPVNDLPPKSHTPEQKAIDSPLSPLTQHHGNAQSTQPATEGLNPSSSEQKRGQNEPQRHRLQRVYNFMESRPDRHHNKESSPKRASNRLLDDQQDQIHESQTPKSEDQKKVRKISILEGLKRERKRKTILSDKSLRFLARKFPPSAPKAADHRLPSEVKRRTASADTEATSSRSTSPKSAVYLLPKLDTKLPPARFDIALDVNGRGQLNLMSPVDNIPSIVENPSYYLPKTEIKTPKVPKVTLKENKPSRRRVDFCGPITSQDEDEAVTNIHVNPLKQVVQNRNNNAKLHKKEEAYSEKAISEKLAAIKQKSRARKVHKLTQRTGRNTAPNQAKGNKKEEAQIPQIKDSNTKQKQETLGNAVQQWAQQTVQRRKLSIFTSGTDSEFATKIQSGWRSHRDQIFVAASLLQTWSVNCDFSPDTMNNDRILRQTAHVLALDGAFRQVGYHWQNGEAKMKLGLVAVEWEGLVPINFSQHGLPADDTCCSVSVHCTAREGYLLSSWSNTKITILLTKAAIEKYCDDQRQRLRLSSIFERSRNRREDDHLQSEAGPSLHEAIPRTPTQADDAHRQSQGNAHFQQTPPHYRESPGRFQETPPQYRESPGRTYFQDSTQPQIHDPNLHHKSANVIQNAFRKFRYHIHEDDTMFLGVPNDFQERLRVYSAVLIQSWYRMCVCKSMFQGLRRIQSTVLLRIDRDDVETIKFHRCFEPRKFETIVEEGFECTTGSTDS